MLTMDRPPVVIDASAAIELVTRGLPGLEATWSNWRASDRLQLVPAHFWAEAGHGLLRGRRSAVPEATARLDAIRETGIEVADRGHDGLVDAVRLAASHGLSVYDALYLQLALDVDGTLATYATALATAAAAEGVGLEDLGEPSG
jgi:predicted nucleic acid-binding protein